MEAEANEPRGSAAAQVRVAELGRTAPQVIDALRTGRLGVAQARELGRLYANPRLRDHLDDETLAGFLDEAANKSFRMFRETTTEWEALTDQDGKRRDHDDALLTEVLERFTQAEFIADWEEAKARPRRCRTAR